MIYETERNDAFKTVTTHARTRLLHSFILHIHVFQFTANGTSQIEKTNRIESKADIFFHAPIQNMLSLSSWWEAYHVSRKSAMVSSPEAWSPA